MPLGVAYTSLPHDFTGQYAEYAGKVDDRVDLRFVGPYGSKHIPTYRAWYVTDSIEVDICFFANMWTDSEHKLCTAREDLDGESKREYDDELQKMHGLITGIALSDESEFSADSQKAERVAGCAYDLIEQCACLCRGEYVDDIRLTVCISLPTRLVRQPPRTPSPTVPRSVWRGRTSLAPCRPSCE